MKVSEVKAQPSFGIYSHTRRTPYGKCDCGKFQDMYINIHTDEFKGIKLYDVYRKTGELQNSIDKYI